jgi:hypothetical protein
MLKINKITKDEMISKEYILKEFLKYSHLPFDFYSNRNPANYNAKGWTKDKLQKLCQDLFDYGFATSNAKYLQYSLFINLLFSFNCDFTLINKLIWGLPYVSNKNPSMRKFYIKYKSKICERLRLISEEHMLTLLLYLHFTEIFHAKEHKLQETKLSGCKMLLYPFPKLLSWVTEGINDEWQIPSLTIEDIQKCFEDTKCHKGVPFLKIEPRVPSGDFQYLDNMNEVDSDNEVSNISSEDIDINVNALSDYLTKIAEFKVLKIASNPMKEQEKRLKDMKSD